MNPAEYRFDDPFFKLSASVQSAVLSFIFWREGAFD